MAKVKSTSLVQCMDCINSTLFQRFENPIIARCEVNGERDVARSKRICVNYRHTAEKKIINKIE